MKPNRVSILTRFSKACLLSMLLLLELCVSAYAGAGQKHFLWRVSSDTNALYLLGSLHLLTTGHYPLNEAYVNAFDDSDIVVFEIDPGVLEKPETIQMMLSKATLGGDKTLDQVLSEKTYRLTEEKLKGLGADILMFSKSAPWFVAVSLGILKLKSLGLDKDEGVDRYLYRMTLGSGKKVEGLETAEYQIDVLAKAGGENQEAFLRQTLNDLDVMEKELDEMLDAWESGDTARFENAMFESYDGYQDVYEVLIAERNRNWLTEIEKYLDGNERCLLVVGSGHLVGKDGLINLLRQKGYKVEQM